MGEIVSKRTPAEVRARMGYLRRQLITYSQQRTAHGLAATSSPCEQSTLERVSQHIDAALNRANDAPTGMLALMIMEVVEGRAERSFTVYDKRYMQPWLAQQQKK